MKSVISQLKKKDLKIKEIIMALRTSTSTSTTSFFFLLLCALLGVTLVSSNELRIHNASEFITFSKSVNSGTNYTGATVYLESDLDFSGGLSEQFEVIGDSYLTSFRGTFDGQGHTISNLAIKSSYSCAGLFGYSSGPVKNIVMDSSCSVTSNYTGGANTHVGGIIGYYAPNTGESSVLNIVNMADVTFEGSTTGDAGYLNLGGIVGYISSSNYDATVRNCANYGSLKHSGVVSESVFIGGIVGYSTGDFSSKILVQNCLNYGPITVTGTSGSLYVGGIVGQSTNTAFTNCVSAGRITSNTGNKGALIGFIYSLTNITHCLWTSDVGCDKAYIIFTETNPLFENSSLVTINATTVSELNEYASKNNGWNKWLLNENNKSVSFKINSNENGFVLSSQFILLPGVDPESDSGLEFGGWFSDPYCNEPFTSSQINEDTTLYGLYGEIISVIFNPNGGTVPQNAKKVVVGGTYGTLPVPNRTGYAFLGWFTEMNESVTNETAVVISRNHALIAHWEEITSQVEIVFGTKDMTEEKAKEIIKQYTDNNDFNILKIELTGSDETRVIIKFNDKEEAESFVEDIRGSSALGVMIKAVSFISEDIGSLASMLHPILFLI